MKHLILLATAAVMTCFSSFAFSGKGGGTEKDPYEITNADEFFEIRNELDACYKLMNDIDLSEFIKEDNPTQGWSPIGNTTTPFTGVLNGNNKTIMGLYINRPNIDNVGLFGCIVTSKISNLAILNANIIGNKNVGTLAGVCLVDYFTNDNVIENIIIQNTIVNSNENCGGVVGGFCINQRYINSSGKIETIIKGCSVTGVIEANNTNAGGICGYAVSGDYMHYNSYSGNYVKASNVLYFSDNFIDAKIFSKGSVGGIVSSFDIVKWNVTNSLYDGDIAGKYNANRNIVKGCISGVDNVCGIVGYYKYSSYGNSIDVSYNLAALDTIRKESSKEIYRIMNHECPNNYAYAGTVALWNKTQITLEDNDFNGMSYGLKTLKKRTTYEGMGFDFGTQWAIKEGETFPYNIYQSEMPEIAEFISGSRAYISGKAKGTGHVYVFIGGNLYESFVVDNEWKVDLGNVPVDTEAYVSVALDGKMPSVQVSAKAEAGSSNPAVKVGDANGDGEIDAADVVAIINHIIGKNSSSFNTLNADVNGDGQVLVDDAVGAVELIMNAQ